MANTFSFQILRSRWATNKGTVFLSSVEMSLLEDWLSDPSELANLVCRRCPWRRLVQRKCLARRFFGGKTWHPPLNEHDIRGIWVTASRSIFKIRRHLKIICNQSMERGYGILASTHDQMTMTCTSIRMMQSAAWPLSSAKKFILCEEIGKSSCCYNHEDCSMKIVATDMKIVSDGHDVRSGWYSRSTLWRSHPDSADVVHWKSLMKNSHFCSSCVAGRKPKGLVCFSLSTVCKPYKVVVVVVVRIDWISSFCFRVTESIYLCPDPNWHSWRATISPHLFVSPGALLLHYSLSLLCSWI